MAKDYHTIRLDWQKIKFANSALVSALLGIGLCSDVWSPFRHELECGRECKLRVSILGIVLSSLLTSDAAQSAVIISAVALGYSLSSVCLLAVLWSG